MASIKFVRRAPAARVLIVSAYADPHLGGVEVVVGQQARTLVALGHEVTVVTSRCGAGGAGREEVDGYTVVRIPAWNGLEERKGVPFPIWSPSALWRLAGLIHRAEVVHVHDAHYGLSVLAAALARRRRPLFITQHIGMVEHDTVLVRLMQRLVYSWVGRSVWRWAEKVTVYNPIVEGFLRGHGVPADNIRLAYNGIDTREFHPGDVAATRMTRARYGIAPDVPVVLFVGRVVAGPGRIPPEVPAGVRFLGPLGRAELRDLYQASDIFAFPAVGEMLTLAMQEAMACGLPVVAAAEEGYSRYGLDPVGLTLIPPEPEAMRSAFLQILADPQRNAYMSAYSRSLAEERFEWQRNAAYLASEYHSALWPVGRRTLSLAGQRVTRPPRLQPWQRARSPEGQAGGPPAQLLAGQGVRTELTVVPAAAEELTTGGQR
jgi:glycosyltransferase involved in cell wall biosynthesis